MAPATHAAPARRENQVTTPQEGGPRSSAQKDDDKTRRGLQLENESADLLSRKGYDVVHRPDTPGDKNPDFLIEGRVFDNYAPGAGTSPRNIWSSIRDKVKTKQAPRIVLNLDDSTVDLGALRKQFDDYPMPGLDEVIVIKDGAIIPFFP